MRNKKIIILMAIIFLAGLVALVFYNSNFKNITDKFLTTGQLCGQLAGRAGDLCLEQTAFSQTDIEACQEINDAGIKDDCLANINIMLAVVKRDLTACEKLNNPMLAKTCLEKIIKRNYEKADCKLLRQEELIIFCLAEANGRLARKNDDAVLCEKIPDSIKKANCLSELKRIDLHSDADKDGLDFLQEIINGADPNNPDTNNNGIKDGAEVKLNIDNQAAGKKIDKVLSTTVSCGEINDKRLAVVCLSEFGYGNLNLLDCDKVKSKNLKEYCFNRFQLLEKTPVVK